MVVSLTKARNNWKHQGIQPLNPDDLIAIDIDTTPSNPMAATVTMVAPAATMCAANVFKQSARKPYGI